MSAHATLPPSGAHRWKRCAGSVAATIDAGDSSSEYAREGSAAHVLGERALNYADAGRKAEFWIGETISIEYEENGEKKSQSFTVDQEMADYVQMYVDQVMREPGELFVEEKFDLSEVYGVEGQFGTGDAVKLDYENERLYVGDLKYGQSQNNIVYAKDNDQLYSYAAGALRQYEMVADWKTITVAIHQPRLYHYDEFTITREALEAWIAETKEDAAHAYSLIGAPMEAIEAAMVPGEKQCQWCSLKATCGPLAVWVNQQVFEDFTVINKVPEQPREAAGLSSELLGTLVSRSDLIESVTREWRAEGKRRLEAGMKIPGWKLVTGKKGNREFSSKDKAEAVMKAARLKSDEMYSKKLITPTVAAKLLEKPKPKVWAKLLVLVTQKDGAPAMALASDKRVALIVAEEHQFKDVTDANDVSDLI